MKSHSITLTPNNRLATWLQLEHAKQQSLPVFETPRILPWATWLQECWNLLVLQENNEKKILLTPTQSLLLWEQIIEADAADHLLNTAATAQDAQQAWELLHTWQIDWNNDQFAITREHQLFHHWARQFQAHCEQKKWIDPAQLSKVIHQAFTKQHLVPPTELTLACFTELPPDRQILINHLADHGCSVTFWETRIQNKSSRLTAFHDQEEEIKAMAQWAKQQRTQHPHSSIACIIPRMTKLRSVVQRVFYDTFEIDQQITNDLPFNLSGGQGFSDIPLISAALLGLHYQQSSFPLPLISRLLRSPFFMTTKEQAHAQARFESYLRTFRQPTFSFNALLKLMEKFDKTMPLLAALSRLQQLSLSKTQLPQAWATTFNQWLLTLGWPGNRALTSAEYQAFNRWKKLLIEFSELDFILGTIPYSRALYHLTQLARSIIFQPESSHTNIQVLGLLEASGRAFDYCWIMDLNEREWPTPSHPNPFITITLQRQLNMPHCSPERELAFCQALTNQLLTINQHVTISFTDQEAMVSLAPSPLVKHLPRISIPLSSSKTLLGKKFPLESLLDSQAPPISPTEIISGGTQILKKQAACPFRAFAEHRLQALPIESPAQGIDARTRGKLLHGALEWIWKRLRTQEALLNLSLDHREALVKEALKNTVRIMRLDKSFKTLLTLELQRQQMLLMKWLNYESTRAPFKVIAIEQWETFTIDRLTVKTCIDRIDELNTGERIIIDYKSGAADWKDWLGPRPNEPQLLIYLTHQTIKPVGLAFAQLRANETRFKGIVVKASLLPHCMPLEKIGELDKNWGSQLGIWHNTLINLAKSFATGEAAVNPKDFHRTCSRCHLQPLCRISDNTLIK